MCANLYDPSFRVHGLRWFYTAALGSVLATGLHAQATLPGGSRAAGLRNLEIVQIETEAGAAAQTLYDGSHALLIGVSNYSQGWRRLPGVPHDIDEVQKALKAHGFSVQTLRDATRRDIEEQFRQLKTLRGNSGRLRLLVYFAGHGHTLRTSQGVKLGYIVPADAPRPDQDPGGFIQSAISMESIESLARELDVLHALFVFDSCFAGSIFRSGDMPREHISFKTRMPVRQFITSGDENQQVPDESVFRIRFVDALLNGDADLDGDGFMTGTELGAYLEDTLINDTTSRQTPRYGKIHNAALDRGDFVFVSPAGPQARPGAAGLAPSSGRPAASRRVLPNLPEPEWGGHLPASALDLPPARK